MKKCEKCDKDHDGSFGSGRFCSRSCANNTGTRSQETKDKIRQSVTKLKPIACQWCGIEFKPQSHTKKFCSRGCNSKNNWATPEYREKMTNINKQTAINRHTRNDTTFGWQSRVNREPSYPESIAIRFFNEFNIEFDREVKIGKYFADFVLKDNIVIEIDGQQHNLPDRIEIDKNKDTLLISLGYIVHRISYPNENIRESLKNIIGV